MTEILHTVPRETPAEVLARYGLQAQAEFKPHPRGQRHRWDDPKGEASPHLDWQIKITYRAEPGACAYPVHSLTYTQGIGHLPGFNHDRFRREGAYQSAVWEAFYSGVWRPDRDADPIYLDRVEHHPDEVEVFSSVLSDISGYLDTPLFGPWAESYGYDSDSRSAEKIFNECRATAEVFAQVLGWFRLCQLCAEFHTAEQGSDQEDAA